MASYDARIISTFADALYARADFITQAYTAVGAIIIGGLGLLLAGAADSNRLIVTVIGLAIGGGIGHFFGSGKAFELRLQAQTLLCQVAIEENTRKAPELMPTEGANAGRSVTQTATPVTAPARASARSGRKCRDCGAPLSSLDEFCPKCSAKVN